VVKRNPTYWQANRPYLDGITFKTVGSDETALETMLTGDAQVYGGLGETALINQAQQHFQVLDQPGTSPYDLQLNTAVAPFNNPKARQAIYAATDFAPILQHIFGNRYPVVQGFTGYDLLPWWAGVIVLLAYSAAIAVCGWWLSLRRDIA